MSRSYDPRAHAYDDQGRHAGFMYVLMLVIALAFGGFVWQLYSSPDVPRIAAPASPYKVQPPEDAANAPDATETAVFDTPAQATTAAPAESAAADAETPPPAAAAAQTSGAPSLPAAPQFVSNGPYVAQLAALQSEAAVEQAWRRLASRAPQLFQPARLDVERADLGARGIYYRVRAGYFADRANAARFCERIRQMGQDCIVAAR